MLHLIGMIHYIFSYWFFWSSEWYNMKV